MKTVQLTSANGMTVTMRESPSGDVLLQIGETLPALFTHDRTPNARPALDVLRSALLKDGAVYEDTTGGGKTNFKLILTAVAEEFDVSTAEILGTRRLAPIVAARTAAIHLCYTQLAWNVTYTARRFKKDHTSIMAALDRIGPYTRHRPGFATKLAKAQSRLAKEPL